MHRYLSSFIISALAYIAIIATMFYLFSKNDYSAKKVKKDNPKCVHFSIIAPAKVKELKPITEKKKKPKAKPKPKKKKKPLQKPKPKPVVKPEPIVEEVIEEEIIEEVQEQPEQEIVQTKTISNVQQQINQDIKEAKQRAFIEELIKKIDSNKSYPNMARRRCIEGVVDVKFIILANGNVEDIQIVSGRSIFKRSTTEAIERSFPIEVDSTLFNFPEEFRLKIAYILK